MVSVLKVWDVFLLDSHCCVSREALWSRAVDGLGVASRFIVVVVVGFGGPGRIIARKWCKEGALVGGCSFWMVSGGAGRCSFALGVCAFDGLGDDGRFIDVGFVGNCSVSSWKLLLLSLSVS